MATLYASFADASLAEKAAGALLDYGVRKEDVSLVANDAHGRAHNADLSAGAGIVGDRVAGAGDRIAGSVAGAVGAHDAAANYETAGAVRSAEATDRRVAVYDNDADVVGTAGTAPDHTEVSAKQGISTTTPGDAEAGAVKGAEWGLGLGVLAGLASLLIPGVGLVVGGGALATAIGGAVGTTVAGAVAGGVTGYLKDQGVPDEAVQRYHGTIEQGGAMLAITLPSGKVDQATAEELISKYGGSDVNSY